MILSTILWKNMFAIFLSVLLSLVFMKSMTSNESMKQKR